MLSFLSAVLLPIRTFLASEREGREVADANRAKGLCACGEEPLPDEWQQCTECSAQRVAW